MARQYFYVVEPKIRNNGPLMVCLHSAGGNAKTELVPNVKRVADAGDDFTGLILNCDTGSGGWWGAKEIDADPDKYRQILTPVENRALATIQWVVHRYHIDRNRIYLHGISMGGSGALGIGMSHGNVFAALQAGVPAGTTHAIYRLGNSMILVNDAGTMNDVPPVFVFFSPKRCVV
jgi:poly(3-hydroxybutyrate) depolymerase